MNHSDESRFDGLRAPLHIALHHLGDESCVVGTQVTHGSTQLAKAQGRDDQVFRADTAGKLDVGGAGANGFPLHHFHDGAGHFTQTAVDFLKHRVDVSVIHNVGHAGNEAVLLQGEVEVLDGDVELSRGDAFGQLEAAGSHRHAERAELVGIHGELVTPHGDGLGVVPRQRLHLAGLLKDAVRGGALQQLSGGVRGLGNGQVAESGHGVFLRKERRDCPYGPSLLLFLGCRQSLPCALFRASGRMCVSLRSSADNLCVPW